MLPPPPRSTPTYTLFPYTTLFRSPTCPTSPARPSSIMASSLRLDDTCIAERRLLPGIQSEYLFQDLVRMLAQHRGRSPVRSEEHTSELQSLMRISYAVFCLKKKKHKNKAHTLAYTIST